MSGPRGERDTELSHIYREGGWPEPRRQIDQAILAAARRKQSFARRWAPPFALAATVVLSFTLFLRVSEEKPEAYAPPALERQSAPPAEPAKTAEPKPEAPPAPAPKPAAARPHAAESLAARKSKPVAKSAPPRAPAPPQPFKQAPKLAPVERPAPAATVTAAPASRPPPAPLKKEASEPARADRNQPAPEPRAANPGALESAPGREVSPTPSASTPPRAPEPFAQAPASGAAGGASGASAASDTGPEMVIRRTTPERSPQTWIDDIRRLKADGRTEAAGRELAEFRKRYPDYALPEDLR